MTSALNFRFFSLRGWCLQPSDNFESLRLWRLEWPESDFMTCTKYMCMRQCVDGRFYENWTISFKSNDLMEHTFCNKNIVHLSVDCMRHFSHTHPQTDAHPHTTYIHTNTLCNAIFKINESYRARLLAKANYEFSMQSALSRWG